MKLFDFTADKDKLSSQITESISANEEESINESLQALAKHVKEGTALCDSPFRHGSKAYIETFQLAKKLRQAYQDPPESPELLASNHRRQHHAGRRHSVGLAAQGYGYQARRDDQSIKG